MIYQIQEVEDADLTNRTVVESKSGLMTDAEQLVWFNGVIAQLVTDKTPIKDLYTAYIVPEMHPWFEPSDASQSIGSSMTDVSRPSTLTDGAAEAPVPFTTVITIELANAANERTAKLVP